MLFREASLTSLRRDSTRVQNGWTDGSRPTAPLPAPPFLIYARRYLCQRIYILIFIIRNIIARAFIALVEKPRTARFAIQLTRGSLARSFSPPFFLPVPPPFAVPSRQPRSPLRPPSLSLSLSPNSRIFYPTLQPPLSRRRQPISNHFSRHPSISRHFSSFFSLLLANRCHEIARLAAR